MIVTNSGDTGTAKRKGGRPKGAKDKKPRVNKNGYTVSKKALAQRRKNSALIPANDPEEVAYNARRIEHMLKIHEIAQEADRKDLRSLESCFVNYMKLCQADGFKVSNIAAYAAMGMDRSAFSSFAKKDDPDIQRFCKMIQTMCAVSRETMIADGDLNPVIGIFWQRNFDGLRNDTEQQQSLQEQNDDEYSGNKSYKDKYRDMIGG